jgi:hypothetical protein
VVGLVGLEPTTPALSRRCSDQLSYRPAPKTKPLAAIPACGVTRASLKSRSVAHAPLGFVHQPTTDKQPISVGKHHLLTPDAPPKGQPAHALMALLSRKEVIQPHLPVRLPCYDFTPVTNPAVVSALQTVRLPTSGGTRSHGVTGGVYKTRERIHRGMLIRDY